MIRIIEKISIRSLDRGTPEKDLPLVPASARAEINDMHEAEGTSRTLNISGTIRHGVPEINDRLSISVTYCDGNSETYGSEDLPFGFDVKTVSGRMNISATYKMPLF